MPPKWRWPSSKEWRQSLAPRNLKNTVFIAKTTYWIIRGKMKNFHKTTISARYSGSNFTNDAWVWDRFGPTPFLRGYCRVFQKENLLCMALWIFVERIHYFCELHRIFKKQKLFSFQKVLYSDCFVERTFFWFCELHRLFQKQKLFCKLLWIFCRNWYFFIERTFFGFAS